MSLGDPFEKLTFKALIGALNISRVDPRWQGPGPKSFFASPLSEQVYSRIARDTAASMSSLVSRFRFGGRD